MSSPIFFQYSPLNTLLEPSDVSVLLPVGIASGLVESEGLPEAPIALPPGIIAPAPDLEDLPDVPVALPPGIILPAPGFLDALFEGFRDVLSLLPSLPTPLLPDSLFPDSEEETAEAPECLPPGLICPAPDDGDLADSLAQSSLEVLSSLEDELTGIADVVIGLGRFRGSDGLLNTAGVEVSNGESFQLGDLDAEGREGLLEALFADFRSSERPIFSGPVFLGITGPADDRETGGLDRFASLGDVSLGDRFTSFVNDLTQVDLRESF